MKRPERSDHSPKELHGFVSPKSYIPALESYADHLERMVEYMREKLKEAYTDGFSDDRFDFDLENYIETPL